MCSGLSVKAVWSSSKFLTGRKPEERRLDAGRPDSWPSRYVASPRATTCEKRRRWPGGRQIDHCTANWLDHAMQTEFNVLTERGVSHRCTGRPIEREKKHCDVIVIVTSAYGSWLIGLTVSFCHTR